MGIWVCRNEVGPKWIWIGGKPQKANKNENGPKTKRPKNEEISKIDLIELK